MFFFDVDKIEVFLILIAQEVLNTSLIEGEVTFEAQIGIGIRLKFQTQRPQESLFRNIV